MTFSGRAHYPMNVRWCSKCKAWKPTGGQFKPFVCAGCKGKAK